MAEEEDFERPNLEPKGHAYRLVKDWHTDCKGLFPKKITVPAGYITDGASIPRFLWPICGDPMSNPRIYAAIVHDWLYENNGKVTKEVDGEQVTYTYTRKQADQVYRDYQIELGIKKWRANIEYRALRLCGWTHWKGDKDEDK